MHTPNALDKSQSSARRLPPWLKRPLPAGASFAQTSQAVAVSGIATVCQHAKCPNRAECWSHRTATFMILGHHCTRRCAFCAVQTGRPASPEPDEPQRLARAAAELGLRHVVITAVARDDLRDGGAAHFAACVQAVRQQCPSATIEVLPSDMKGSEASIHALCDAAPHVYNHNLETVERLTPGVRPQAGYERSLGVIRSVRAYSPEILTKSGLMVGLGEERDELRQAFDDLVCAGCRILTIGQYLQPSSAQAPVQKYYPPDEFRELADEARAAGFFSVAAGPFVRSSYNAAEVFEAARAAAPQAS
ncbi:MAG: lipoyl synthase [Phycisphaerae bacterium]|nr:lipoyl synthase [Phycisphaerae bacterium]